MTGAPLTSSSGVTEPEEEKGEIISEVLKYETFTLILRTLFKTFFVMFDCFVLCFVAVVCDKKNWVGCHMSLFYYINKTKTEVMGI